MEMIKEIVKQFYPIVMMVACVLFVITVFFSSSVHGGRDIFAGVAMFFSPMIKEDSHNTQFHDLDSFVSEYVPVIKYGAGVQRVGDGISFKGMFEVVKEDGSIVRGDTEDEFSIYLLDIKNQVGNSVLIHMTEDEIMEIIEIPAPFVYEKEQDILYCFETGIYTVYIKVFGANGGQEIYKFQLPVESS